MTSLDCRRDYPVPPQYQGVQIGVPQLPRTSQASLRNDLGYVGLLEAESTWPMKYNFSRPNPVTRRAHPIQGLRSAWVGAGQVQVFNKLIPRQQRVAMRASQHRPQTQLFGTAPYTALGRGVMNHVDVNSALKLSNRVPRKPTRTVMEREWDRRHFVAIPEELRALPVDPRLGEGTRVGPEYMQPHQD
jgi:hypothetical protein